MTDLPSSYVESDIKTELRAPINPAEVFDFILEKDPKKDFVILTISDPQMLYAWWHNEESDERNSLIYTLEELIKTTNPDLIVCTGDIAADGYAGVFKDLGGFFDSFGIPWTTVWGNHDYTYKIAAWYGMPLNEMETLYSTGFENCLFKAGDPDMGSGNFTIGIRENGKFTEALFMMDSHTVQQYTDENGNEFWAEASINESQQKWYRNKVEEMKLLGCNDSMIVTHQPLTGHQKAYSAAIEYLNVYESLLTPDSTKDGAGWKDEYKDTSFGIGRMLSSFCATTVYGHIHPDDGMHDLIRDLGHTKNAICGHCHENNASVLFEGVRYTHGLKTGQGANSYWTYDFGQNGGTVIRVGSDGVKDIYHEYIPIRHIFDRSKCHANFRAPFDPEF